MTKIKFDWFGAPMELTTEHPSSKDGIPILFSVADGIAYGPMAHCYSGDPNHYRKVWALVAYTFQNAIGEELEFVERFFDPVKSELGL